MKRKLKISFLFAFILMLIIASQAFAGSWVHQGSVWQTGPLTTAPDGTIWMAGANGSSDYGHLYKWTGSAFQDKGAWGYGTSSSNQIWDIKAAPDGTIWVAGDGGYLAQYNPATSTWSNKGTWAYSTKINRITIALDGSIWAGGNNGYTAQWNGSWVSRGSWGNSNNISAMFTSSDGTIWAAGPSGRTSIWNGSSWTSKGGSWAGGSSGSSSSVNSMVEDNNGVIYKAGGGGLINAWNGSAWVEKTPWGITYYVPSETYAANIYSLSVAPDNTIWAVGEVGAVASFNGSSWSNKGTWADGNSWTIQYSTVAPDGSIWCAGTYGGNVGRYTAALSLTVNSTTANSCLLNMSYDGGNVSTVKIQKSTDNVTFTDVATISGVSTYNVTGLSSGTVYYFRLSWKANNLFWMNTASVSTITIPAAPATPTGSTYGVSWSNDANNPGRSGVVVNWAAVQGASGYRIYLYDGYAYRMVQDVGNVTSWDSRVAKIYPAEAVLNAITDNTSTANLFVAATTGYNLPDKPTKLYQKTAGTTNDTALNYWIKVSPYNASGEGAQSNAYTPTLPDRTDTVAPVGTLSANEGDYNTTTKNITLTSTASDDKSGVYQMQFSNDNVSWSPWEAYSTTKIWQIEVGPGTKPIYQRLRDLAGNVSNLLSTSIYMVQDVTPPTLKVTINSEAKTTDTKNVILNINPSDDFTPYGDILIRVSNDGNFSGVSWRSQTPTLSWTLAGPDGINYVFVQAKDQVGNVITASANIILMTEQSSPEGNITPPEGVNVINVNGQPVQVINKSQATLKIVNPQNISFYSYSFDGITWSPEIKAVIVTSGGTNYISQTVNFPYPDGYKTLYIKYKNQNGGWSGVFEQQYIVDTTAPVVNLSTVGRATATKTNGKIDLVVEAQDNVSTNLKYSFNGANTVSLPSDGLITVTVTQVNKLNTIRIKVFDDAGNASEKALSVWYLPA